MPKIYCADTSCEFCNDKGVCTAKKVALSWHSVMTLLEGRQEFNRCKTYQKSKLSIELEQRFKELAQKMNRGSAASKCDNCEVRKVYAKLFDKHWMGEDDCPVVCKKDDEGKEVSE